MVYELDFLRSVFIQSLFPSETYEIMTLGGYVKGVRMDLYLLGAHSLSNALRVHFLSSCET